MLKKKILRTVAAEYSLSYITQLLHMHVLNSNGKTEDSTVNKTISRINTIPLENEDLDDGQNGATSIKKDISKTKDISL